MTEIQGRRTALEELEVIEKSIADRIKRNPQIYVGSTSGSSGVLGGKKRSYRETLLQQHEISGFINQYKQICLQIKGEIEEPETVNRETEQLSDPSFEFVQFDKMLADIKERHRNISTNSMMSLSKIYEMYSSDVSGSEVLQNGFLNLPTKPNFGDEPIKKAKKNILSSFASNIDFNSLFSDEEAFGKYLDLVIFHERYLNLKDAEKIPYNEYLDIFYELPYSNVRRNEEYLGYIKDLSDYLKNFLHRSQPLSNPENIINKFEQDFESYWVAKQKEDTISDNGIYCQVCNKTFTKQTVFQGHLEGKKHKKALQLKEQQKISNDNDTSNNMTNNATTSQNNKPKKMAYYEFMIKGLASFLDKKQQDTKANTERRQALTDRERMLEIAALHEESEEEEDNDDDDDDFSNPLKLPIGFDGKPIPFWLYKLHGLGVEYNCEICGNFVYKGRKAFEKHFVEARHMYGLKCLGITPGATFKGITDINDATQLWEKIRRERRKDEGEVENAVEVEDEEGNVMSEKVYNDLKKQGLL